MRTTLTIDDDVMVAAKSIAALQHRPIGEIISDLARRALQRPPSKTTRNGIPLLSPVLGKPPVTLDIVNALRDEHP